MILSSVAVAATGATISGGLLAGQPALTSASGDQPGDSQLDAAAAGLDLAQTDGSEADREVADREPVLSRSSDRRETSDPLKEAALAVDGVNAVTGQEDLSDADPREIARALLAEFGFSADQFSCLDSLYTRESNWNVFADNPTSSAYGIPQALPGSKMASAGPDWATNPVTQIRWGLGYIQDRYGSPCGAWAHSESNGWY